MKLILSSLLFCCLVLGCHSALFFERQIPIAGHEGQCYDKDDFTFYRKGEQMRWNLKDCGRKICGGSTIRGGPVVIETQTCGKTVAPPGCFTKTNPELPYPNCCERIICPKPGDNELDFDNNFNNFLEPK